MKFVSDQFRRYLKSAKDFCVYKILHADDPPHRLALGIAIGMFVTFTPLIGFQMAISVFLAWLLRANKLVGVPIVWISNPFTIIPIYYPCYAIGCWMLGTPVVVGEWERMKTAWGELLGDPTTRWGDKVQFWWEHLMNFVGPLWLGCLLVATLAGIGSYYVSLLSIRKYRLARWGQLMPPSATPVESIEDDSVSSEQKSAKGESAA
jgi:uncharacterized protein